MLVAAMASCSSTKSTVMTATLESSPENKVTNIAGNATTAAVNSVFWGKLLGEACRQMDKENICLSPLSAQLAMSMIVNGAEGDTKKEICETMQFGDDTNTRSRELLDNLDDKYCEVKIANSIWIKEAFDVKQEFIDTNKVYFDALVERVKFNGGTVERVNGWCKENTNGRIPSILDRFNESDRMLLINALYFKAAWDKPFKEQNTTEKKFTTEKGEEIKVPTMMMRSSGLFYKDDILAITSKRLQFGYNMLFVLPNEGVKCDEAAEHLAKNLDTYLRNMTVCDLTLSLPKFTSEFGGSLKPLLEKLGIKRAFDRRAELKGISEEQLYISDIMQKTFIDVNEKGTEAAAVTAIMCGFFATRPPEVEILTFDRPFIYAIVKESNNEVMFTGKVGNPIVK
jgi:serpin B